VVTAVATAVAAGADPPYSAASMPPPSTAIAVVAAIARLIRFMELLSAPVSSFSSYSL
jgi:hypothetical protein